MKKAAVMLYPLFSLQEISCLTELFLFHGKEIVTYAAERAPVRSEDGFTVLPDRSFQDFCREEIDCLVLPGIWEPLPVLLDRRNIAFLEQFRERRGFWRDAGSATGCSRSFWRNSRWCPGRGWSEPSWWRTGTW